MATVITVQGQHTARYAAERGTAHLAVSFDGPEREEVVTSATSTARQITEHIDSLHDASAGPIVSWSSDRVRVWSDRPWNNEGAQLPLVHHAQISITVAFSEFETLADVLGLFTVMPGVHLGGIEWELTKATRISALAEVRSRAVSDATDKARVYAQAVGLGTVRAVAIADPGMLGTGSPEPLVPRMEMMMARGTASDISGPKFAFTPDQIEVSAAVDARFEAN
ncbi:SIMPL domain-containing protein [Salinibacterium sp. ZJ77]|uniref:SIMPL domain-containing protein n=1 Tax=Salinibacterium sp. ZJ77 TaxID=2708337 RepID=UPI00141E6DB0|nr:SIMPL domain-containing protein [Salinibacterium sp. ZJ77]